MKWTKVNGGWLDEDNNYMSDEEAEARQAQQEALQEEDTD